MKVVCAWCEAIMGFKCPFCAGPLSEAPDAHYKGHYMVCHNEITTVWVSIENMQVSHGICDNCRDREALRRNHPDTKLETEHHVSPGDRAHIAALDGMDNRGHRPRKRETK